MLRRLKCWLFGHKWHTLVRIENEHTSIVLDRCLCCHLDRTRVIHLTDMDKINRILHQDIMAGLMEECLRPNPILGRMSGGK